MSDEPKVIQRQPLATATSLPERLVEYLESTGRHYSLQLLDDRTEVDLDMMGIEPFFIDEVKDTDPELHELLTRRNRHSDGMVHKGDTVLCTQSVEARRQVEEQELHMRRLQHSGEEATKQVKAFLEQELGYDPQIEGGIADLPVDVTKDPLDLPLAPQ
jgi:hypothetical protein